MALSVEVASYGLCQTSHPYAVMVINVQQEAFQAWTVYRRTSSFFSLSEQMQSQYPGTPLLPRIDASATTNPSLETSRLVLDQWLKAVILNPNILRTQAMYQFLCVEANCPPPFLEILRKAPQHQVGSDEMDMDEMFAEGDDEEEELDEDEESECTSASDAHSDRQKGGSPGKKACRSSGGCVGERSLPMGKSNAAVPSDADDDENDGLDIQSLSVVTAEFMFDRQDVSAAGRSLVTMSADSLSAPDASEPKRIISLESFDIIKVIGKGSFGKVFLVRDKASSTLHALKVLKKDYIIRKNQVEHTKTERSVLGYIHHPYIVGLTMAFQTADKLFFVLDYCAGGELFFHLGKVGRFPEERAKFYAAQITLALEYVHEQNIIYRDLKPENVLLDHLGNIRLTDFGLSKEGVSHHSTGANSFCGTPEYIAPEVLLRQGHGRAVDWWSLGALLYEMISSLPPFYSQNRDTMFDKIMKAELTFPSFMSSAAKDILSSLLVRDPTKRLGSGERNAAELKEHVFFASVDWEALMTATIVPPWAPVVTGSLDVSQFDNEFTSMQAAVTPDVRGAYFGEKSFEGFTYVDDSASQLMKRATSAPLLSINNNNVMTAAPPSPATTASLALPPTPSNARPTANFVRTAIPHPTKIVPGRGIGGAIAKAK